MRSEPGIGRLAAIVAVAILAVSPSWLLAQAAPANATFKCKDGTYSTAASARGACSRHGGIAETLRAAGPAAAPAAAAAPSGAAPANATARCKDGTYSTSKQRRGACSHHGGVAEWLKDIPK